MTGAEQSSVHAVLANERAAHLQTVIELVPQTIAYLQIPLTPARAARLADFIARTGIGAQALVLDLLDDVIFDVALSDGGKSCVQGTSSYPQSSGKSADSFQQPRTQMSQGCSDHSQSSSGHTIPRRSSPQSCGETCEQLAAGFPARSTPQRMSGPSCSQSPQIQTERRAND